MLPRFGRCSRSGGDISETRPDNNNNTPTCNAHKVETQLESEARAVARWLVGSVGKEVGFEFVFKGVN
jgi:hypothetical protein